jgi:hypothetical protein
MQQNFLCLDQTGSFALGDGVVIDPGCDDCIGGSFRASLRS